MADPINSNQPLLAQATSPEFREKVAVTHPSVETLELLLQRRSLVAKDIVEPGPNEAQLQQLLQIASRVPDHKKLAPWRFILFQEQARVDFGEILAEAYPQENPNASAEQIEFERNRFTRAPLVIAVVSNVNLEAKNVPEWEQILCSGAVCQNLLIAANAMGFAAQWLTEWYCYHEAVLPKMGLTESERIAGFLYIGTAGKDGSERQRPVVKDLTTIWTAE